jgi:hypothetical protein
VGGRAASIPFLISHDDDELLLVSIRFLKIDSVHLIAESNVQIKSSNGNRRNKKIQNKIQNRRSAALNPTKQNKTNIYILSILL